MPGRNEREIRRSRSGRKPANQSEHANVKSCRIFGGATWVREFQERKRASALLHQCHATLGTIARLVLHYIRVHAAGVFYCLPAALAGRFVFATSHGDYDACERDDHQRYHDQFACFHTIYVRLILSWVFMFRTTATPNHWLAVNSSSRTLRSRTLKQPAQRLAQEFSRAIYPRLHRLRTARQDHANFGVGEFFVFGKHKRRAEFFG